MVAVKKRNLPVFTLSRAPPPACARIAALAALSPRQVPAGCCVLPLLHSCLFPQFQWRALRLEGSVPRGFILNSLFSLSFILC